MNIARNAALWAGCPVIVSGQTVNRFCSSGLQAIAIAAHQIINEGAPCTIGAGIDSISLVQPKMVKGCIVEKQLMKTHPALWMPMIDTADLVAHRYKVPRARLDEYALLSQQRTAAAQKAGKFDHEIVPMETVMAVKNKETGEVTKVPYTVTKDECNRPSTTLESLQKLDPVRLEADPNATVQSIPRIPLRFPASCCRAIELTCRGRSPLAMRRNSLTAQVHAFSWRRVLPPRRCVHAPFAALCCTAPDAPIALTLAFEQGCSPLGAFKGFVVAGCSPEEMGIGPTAAVPRLLERHGLKVRPA